jgi:hypothetical protein
MNGDIPAGAAPDEWASTTGLIGKVQTIQWRDVRLRPTRLDFLSRWLQR